MAERVVDPHIAIAPGPAALALAEPSFVEPLVARISDQYGAVADEVRAHALHLLHSYEGARIRSYVPILVEKRLREAYRPRPSAG